MKYCLKNKQQNKGEVGLDKGLNSQNSWRVTTAAVLGEGMKVFFFFPFFLWFLKSFLYVETLAVLPALNSETKMDANIKIKSS